MNCVNAMCRLRLYSSREGMDNKGLQKKIDDHREEKRVKSWEKTKVIFVQ